MDMMGYEKYLAGELTNYVLPEDYMTKSLAELKNLPKAPANKSGKW
jgi:hypothetical protein